MFPIHLLINNCSNCYSSPHTPEDGIQILVCSVRYSNPYRYDDEHNELPMPEATLKKTFCFRSSGCPFLKPVGRPHFFFPLIFFLVGKYCPFLEFFFFFVAKMKKKVLIRTFLNHPAATPETEVLFSMA